MTTKRIGYDLRHISLGSTGVAGFALKRDAVAFAKAQGWRATNVSFAFNRFSAFFVVAQVIADDLRLVCKNGSTLDIPHPGRG